MKLRDRVYQILETTDPNDRAGRLFARGISGLIVFNVVAIALETVPRVGERWSSLFWGIELVCVAVFTVE